jgi:glycosyltransferase involved in cell wall biosynthesis
VTPSDRTSPASGAVSTTPPVASRVGFVSGMLEGSGGLELFELSAAQGLAGRGWDVVCAYDEPGDLLGRWSATASVHAAADVHEDATAALRDVDVLYVHDTHRLPAALAVGRRIDKPVVGHLHLPPFHLRTRLAARLRGRHRYAIDEAVIGRRTAVDRFIAVSNHTRRTWIDAGLPADRIEVVHNGVDIDRFRPAAPGERGAVRECLGIDDDVFVVGFVGRLERMKGLTQLFRAFAAVDAATNRRMRLVVVGGPSRRMEGEVGAAREAFVAELHRSAPPGTTFLGRRHDVDELYRGMDLVVVPSQWEEPFGLVAAEALASGVPVLGTRRGGLAEILAGPLATNLVGTSWRSIARGIARHVENPAHGRRFGREGRRAVEASFDVAKTVQGIEQVLRGVA